MTGFMAAVAFFAYGAAWALGLQHLWSIFGLIGAMLIAGSMFLYAMLELNKFKWGARSMIYVGVFGTNLFVLAVGLGIASINSVGSFGLSLAGFMGFVIMGLIAMATYMHIENSSYYNDKISQGTKDFYQSVKLGMLFFFSLFGLSGLEAIQFPTMIIQASPPLFFGILGVFAAVICIAGIMLYIHRNP